MKVTILLILLFQSSALLAKDTISAKSYMIEETNSKKILDRKNTTTSLPMASITKLPTALLVSKNKNLNEYIKVTKTTVRRNEGDKSAFLTEGEFYTRKDLLLTMLVSSTNVSALSLATDVSGSPENFVNDLNSWAKENKLTATKFGDTFGLSPDSKSSVDDISKILDLVEQNKSLYEILTTTDYSIKEKNGKNQNLTTTNEMPTYKDFKIFGKTGTTKLAGKCFAGFITKGDNRWKIIVLGSENVFSDIKNLIQLVK